MKNLINDSMIYMSAVTHPQHKYSIFYIDGSSVSTHHGLSYLINLTLLKEGANIKTREQYGKHILDVHKLIPIMIYATEDFVLFPIYSKKHFDYTLINSKHISDIQKYHQGTKIIFKNKEILILPVNTNFVKRKFGESLRLLHYQKQHLNITT